ncbi:STAS domain-containing protein [Micromonospora coxensis]|uniref:Anti-sigma factor antagonist n=1 Tax=Micromonospora coxensis TaxID=356852 RepID=A0A1C5H1D6_9ACTN|nr:STAS domain-containing protein [Micromonospora coxensis]SCG39810.1 anti-sigma B factor antagonist [Micromonospora coxensis]
MTPPTWTHRVRAEGDRIVLLLDGEIDVNGATALRRLFDAMIADAAGVDVDLRAVSFIDSTVIGTLVVARNVAREAGKTFVVSHPTGNVARTLRITGVLDLLSPAGH